MVDFCAAATAAARAVAIGILCDIEMLVGLVRVEELLLAGATETAE